MRRFTVVVPLLIVAASFIVVAAYNDTGGRSDHSVITGTEGVSVDDAQFIGATKCRTCHRKPESGEQYPKWEASPHAQAFLTLASDKAKAIGAERGIDNPQESAECLQCHVTGYGAPAELLGDKYSMEEGVGCESCHGAGGNYYKKSTMVGVTTGEIEASSVGLVVPDETVCTGCHNDKSPTFEGFNFEEYSAKIAHPIPEETKASYKAGG